MDIQVLDSEKSAMQNVKQRFFALRNGLLADRLRVAGSPYRIIFGLNLPQLREVAGAFGVDAELAELLWANDSTRESRLLAPMLVDAMNFRAEDAARWLSTLKGVEEADILCHSLLRHLDFTDDVIFERGRSDNPLDRYVALRLMFAKVSEQPEAARAMAQAELERCDEGVTRGVAAQLLDEANFILDARRDG